MLLDPEQERWIRVGRGPCAFRIAEALNGEMKGLKPRGLVPSASSANSAAQRFKKEASMTDTHTNNHYLMSEITSRIIACAIEVHKALGPGFEEVFYQRALERELSAAGLEATREVWIDVHYKGTLLGKKRVDFVIQDCLLEIKAKAALEDVDKVQTLSYLKASGYSVGLLINFGGVEVEVKRLANTKDRRNATNVESLRR